MSVRYIPCIHNSVSIWRNAIGRYAYNNNVSVFCHSYHVWWYSFLARSHGLSRNMSTVDQIGPGLIIESLNAVLYDVLSSGIKGSDIKEDLIKWKTYRHCPVIEYFISTRIDWSNRDIFIYSQRRRYSSQSIFLDKIVRQPSIGFQSRVHHYVLRCLLYWCWLRYHWCRCLYLYSPILDDIIYFSPECQSN